MNSRSWKTSVKTPDSHSSDYLPPMRVSWFTAVRWDAVESRLYCILACSHVSNCTVYIADWSIRAAAPLGLTHEETLWCTIQRLPHSAAKAEHQPSLAVENCLIRRLVSSLVSHLSPQVHPKVGKDFFFFLLCVEIFQMLHHSGSEQRWWRFYLWSSLWTVAYLSLTLSFSFHGK